MSAFGGKAALRGCTPMSAFDPKRTCTTRRTLRRCSLISYTHTSTMKSPINTLPLFASVALLTIGFCTAQAQNAPQSMRFFVTSAGSGKGGDLGGLDGADARCQSLAAGVGAGTRTWHAYLSTQATAGV